ncbi:hypothetical protein [Mycolicibacterium aubagnense]|uniref:Uncharacterized protein n=1 Tax=Mycolicibacterium aubagnense TaxID=319707 RepID=A0ABM7IJM0_9MYCO|nr:hypothetical protein [Mycolicibacterium aubagnense]WGI31679.1 hypothetical protein QDT91_20985 [Mycolicibacterium aubagnense]BBX86839.1 hypothetical protein MAUB_47120 [Mycolicibacterium aubagnense]
MSGNAWQPIQVPDPDHAIIGAQRQITYLPDGGVQTSTRIQYKNGSTVTDTDIVHETSGRGVTTTTTDSTKHIESKDTTVTIDSSSHTVLEQYAHTSNWTTTLTPADGPSTTEQGQTIWDPETDTNTETVTTTYPGGTIRAVTTVWSDAAGGVNDARQHTDEYDENGKLTDSTDQTVWMARDGSWEPKPTTSAPTDGHTTDDPTQETDDGEGNDASTDGEPTDDSGTYGPRGPVTPADIDSGGGGDGDGDGSGSGDGTGEGSGEGEGEGSGEGSGEGEGEGSGEGEGEGSGSGAGAGDGDSGGPGADNNPFEHAV